MMRTTVQSFVDERGNPVDEVDIEDSNYSRAVFRHVDAEEDRVLLAAETEDERTETIAFNLTNKQYVGIEIAEGTVHDIPDDLVDVLHELGYTPINNNV